MTKIKAVILIIIFAILACGLLFGLSKVGDFLNEKLFYINSKKEENNSADVSDAELVTWYAANLPGAEQMYFYNFNDGISDVSALDVRFGEYFNVDGKLEFEGSADVYLLSNNEMTDIGDVNNYVPGDVFVYDFDLTHNVGTPATSFGSEVVKFSNKYYNEFSESGGVGDPVNVFCLNVENQTGSGSFDQLLFSIGENFSETVHITVLQYIDCCIYYVNGIYIYTDKSVVEPLLYLSSLAYSPDLSDSLALDYGTVVIDNLECVKFGDGTGSYNGILIDYKSNSSLKISDLWR